jgi:sortase A
MSPHQSRIMIGTDSALRKSQLATIERVLFAIAGALLGWYLLQHAVTLYEQAAASRELESVRMPVAAGSTPRVTLAHGELVGRLEITRLGVSAIVREGDDSSTLRHAVGHIPDTALPGESGNSGLAGHRDTFFRGLRNARVGDRIRITTPRSVLDYVVRVVRVVDPDDVSVLSPTTAKTLTLVTCYPFYYIGSAPKRFIVQAELASDGRQ